MENANYAQVTKTYNIYQIDGGNYVVDDNVILPTNPPQYRAINVEDPSKIIYISTHGIVSSKFHYVGEMSEIDFNKLTGVLSTTMVDTLNAGQIVLDDSVTASTTITIEVDHPKQYIISEELLKEISLHLVESNQFNLALRLLVEMNLEG